MLADSIPRYEMPSWDMLDDDPEPAEIMRDCMHCSACLRLLESFTGEQFDTTNEVGWERAAKVADCFHCLETA